MKPIFTAQQWGGINFDGVLSHVEANRNTTQEIANSSDIAIVYSNETEDTLSEYNASTGVFTASSPGRYLVCARYLFESAVYAAGHSAIAKIYKNDAEHKIGELTAVQAAGSHFLGAGITARVTLAAGDYITIRARQSSGNPVNIIASAAYNWLTIDQIL